MQKALVIILVVLIIFIVWFCIDHRKKLGTYPKIFRDTIEDMQWKLLDKNRPAVKDAVNIEQDLKGYEYNDKVKDAVQNLEKREKMFTRHESLGKLTEVENATKTAFTLGDLYGYNVYYQFDQDGIAKHNEPVDRENINKAKNYYGKVITRLNTNPTAVENPRWMMDRIENFYVEHEIALPTTFTDTVNKLPLPAKKITSDPQNVHDRNVNNNFTKIYDRIKTLDGGDIDVSVAFNEVSEYAKKHPKSAQIAKALDKIDKNDNHIVSNYNDTEKGILAHVWNRINSADNLVNNENSENMKNMLMDSLCDGADVCSVGRVSRILDSLVLMDSDPEISKPVVTNEMLRNEIFTLANKTINDQVNLTGKRKEYDAGEMIPELDAIKHAVKNTITEQYSDKTDKANLDKIIGEVEAII